MPVAVKRRFFVRRDDLAGRPRHAVGWLSVVTQPDFLVRHSIGVEFGDHQRGVRFGFKRDVGDGFIEPLFPKQRVEFVVAQMVGGVKEQAARGSGVEQLPKAPRQLQIVQFVRRQWRVAESSEDLAGRTPGAIFCWIKDRWLVVRHGGIVTRPTLMAQRAIIPGCHSRIAASRRFGQRPRISLNVTTLMPRSVCPTGSVFPNDSPAQHHRPCIFSGWSQNSPPRLWGAPAR